jgi:uncharacterized protein YhaN
MRITGLHLLAYGHFTGYSLDLGQGPDLSPRLAPPPPPGLHVVYGHNEAGKSTTLRALSSVLFGYPHQVIDGFRHDPKDIAIGIDLVAADGRTLSFERRRRGKRTLSAPDGSALNEDRVQNFLGGVSRDVFEKVFALDHHRLRAHAQALLADGGSLGFSLAEAGSGVAGLKAVLDKLKAERAGLFLATGTRPKLNQAIADLVRLRKEARQFTVSPADYRSHEKRILETEAELQAMRERRKGIESGIVRLQRIAKNLPLRAEHHALTQRIDALDGVPALPPEFAQQRIKASADLDAARVDLATASAAIQDLARRIAAIAIDDDILARSGDIEALAQKRPIIEKQEAEGPRREAERDALLVRAADLMARAELDGSPGDLAGQLPSPHKRKTIQTLADAGKKLMAQRAALQDSAAAAARLLKKAQNLDVQTPKPRPVGDLSRTLTAADKLGDITDDIARRTRALERKTKVLNETIVGLGLPLELPGTAGAPPAEVAVTGRVAILRELALPPEKTEARYADWFAGLDKQIKDAHCALERLNAELAENAERIVAVKTAGDIATEDDLKAARRARDEGWALVRALYVDRHGGLEDVARRFAPGGRIAETYDAHVREADRVVDTLRVRVKESTELAILRRQAASLETKKAGVTESLKVLVERREVLRAEWRALWPAGLITVQSPGEMIEWLARRSAALAAADELAEERDAVRELIERERAAREALAAAMMAFAAEPPPDGLDALRDQARSIIAEAADAKSRYDKAETAVRGLSEQKVQADEAANRIEAHIKAWVADWRKALAEAGLPSDQTVEAAGATLEVISELDGVKSKIDGLNHRIEAMRADRDTFADAVAGIAAGLPDAPAGAASELCRWLEEQLRIARDARMECRGLTEQLQSRTADRDRASDRLRRSSAALEALCAQAGAAGPDELTEIERQSAEKHDALRECEKIETRVREDGGGRNFTALFDECDDIPGDRIPADLISLKADRDDLEARIDKLSAERGALQNEFDTLLRQNQAADLTQAAAAVSAEIEDAVEAYVDLTVQETLLRAAIDVYRDRNQGPILTRARDLFAQLTGGAYTGLRADVEGGETILIAEDAARGSLELDALSDGTVDAVYLALRLAVVQEHNATHEPLPFIADDLLLNLDNKRSEAALRTLAELAKSTQVLMFTHHAHMVELARRAVPTDILVEHSLSSHAGRAERRYAVGR